MRLIEGFRESIDKLNLETVSSSQVLLPHGYGRAYLYDSTDSYYGDEIHIQSIMEEHKNRIQAASKDASLKGGIFAGAAGFVNLSYMGAAQSSAGILYDFNAHQKIFWDELLNVIAESPSLEKFQSTMPSTLKNVMFKINTLEVCEDLETVGRFTRLAQERKNLGTCSSREIRKQNATKLRDFKSEKEFLDWMQKSVSDKADTQWKNYYSHLHEMAKAGAIGTMTFDICDNKAGDQLADCLEEKISLLYVSNIFRFLTTETDFANRENDGFQDNTSQAEKNLTRLLGDDGIIVGDMFVLDRQYKRTETDFGKANNIDLPFKFT